jgi:hypothetical protein
MVLSRRLIGKRASNVLEAEPGTVCGIAAYDTAWADWWFVPHALEWGNNQRRLEQAAEKIIGLHPAETGFNDKLIENFRIPSELRRIREMFRPMNSNGVSLSLYAGPPPDLNGRISYGSPRKHPVGWLLTGDAPLNSEPRFSPWKESFKTIAQDVGHLMLPHHGAARNFNSELLTFAEDAICFATVNSDDDRQKKRPPCKVRRQVGDRLEVVSEAFCKGGATLIKKRIGPPQPNPLHPD